jgi:transcriptional regulator GlxA family with amidase domain
MSWAADLWERLQEPQSWDQRFGVCDNALSRLQTEFEAAPELRKGWAELVSSGGRISIEELASQTGYSRQHLTRRFRDEFGLTPKLAARIVRFERARRMIQSIPSFVSMAPVAASTGYYDQAHMYRDALRVVGGRGSFFPRGVGPEPVIVAQ